MDKTVVSHNPFGRYAIVRRIVPHTACSWCGNPGRFQYGSEPDDSGRANWDRKVFCSIQCARAYHGSESFYGSEALS
jgi:hypothetical protein